ncbi:MAG: TetR family transcriptional regulator [Clostridiales bacterium]|jgi:AcrR family transcriptional regulator|nr:TetR family transcriptional regulator [Clostridiales bacterium]
MPRTSEQLKQIKEESKENILHAALDIFAKRGLYATSIGDIAKKANISNGLAYHYFQSKDDIFAELLKKAVERFSGAINKLNTMNLTPSTKVKFLSRFMLETINDDNETSSFFMIMMQAGLTDEVSEKVANELRVAGEPIIIIANIIKNGRETGEFCEGESGKLATLYWSTFQGMCMYKIIQGKDFVVPDPSMLNRILLKE